jgi:hypothetical protein
MRLYYRSVAQTPPFLVYLVVANEIHRELHGVVLEVVAVFEAVKSRLRERLPRSSQQEKKKRKRKEGWRRCEMADMVNDTIF